MNYLTILLFVTLVIPFALKEYQKDRGKNTSAKVINIMVSFILFYHFANSLKAEFSMILSDPTIFQAMLQNNIGFLTPLLSTFSWFIYLILSFVLLGIVVLLALRKDKSRVLFLKIIPVIFIFKSIHLYKYFMNKSVEVSLSQALIFILCIMGILCLSLYILYTRKFFKIFFQHEKSLLDNPS